ncbi:LysR substrate-binding domain-containing protein [Methylovulum psychrotolerans]|uniref:DNA-binding transcriptional regulator OxyR n=1 Tax=Methylovulum psychrotolerans TaxID=1704499 RepID=A0A1Z4BU10_9GAMM|nr:LysR substrate-binding domain-containing protein [Methylovulum psychrotolerans]ASF44801.1 DNA-binding transcriptional regulator OxyR [Methylovulum psychrotolerans]
MNLRDLHYLIAVADLRSFVQAAERCHISQPTLSTQIKKVEDSLGVQIFERTNKKVLPTELGEQIIASARRILQEVGHINELARIAQDPLAGNLRLGAFPTLATYIFPQLVPLIKQTLPKVRLILVEEKTEQLLQQLKQGQIDAALLALPIIDDYLATVELFADEFFLAVAADHPLASKATVNPADLSGQALLLLDEGHCLRGHALQICQLNGLQEQQDVRATGLETLRQMVRAGTGITFMPRVAIRTHDEGICYLPFALPAPSRTIGLVWRKTSHRGDLLKRLGELVQTLSWE